MGSDSNDVQLWSLRYASTSTVLVAKIENAVAIPSSVCPNLVRWMMVHVMVLLSPVILLQNGSVVTRNHERRVFV
jgi:hypothetical protein